MKAFLLGLSALACMANNDLPPTKYRGNPPPTLVIVVDNTNSDLTCGKAPKGQVTLGCEFPLKAKHGTAPSVVVTMSPCNYPEATDEMSYAHLMCHEFGHVNGWNANHNN